MSTAAGDFARVLAEAGEPEPAALVPGERALIELRAGLDELNARRMAHWQQLEASRQAGWEAYRQGCELAGIEPRPREHFPWMTPPRPCEIW